MAKREVVHVDTHVVVWLYLGKKVFSEKARKLFVENDVRISPMVRFELGLLHEIKRITDPLTMLKVMKNNFEITEEKVDFSKVITRGMMINFTRDPFDRLIVAHAKHSGATLITKDKTILENCEFAVW